MVGKKTFEAKTHTSFNLEERVPKNNLYRKLKHVLDWDFLYEAVAPYYGTCGHESIDPVVFFKLTLVGYLENRSTTVYILTEPSSESVSYDWIFYTSWDTTWMKSCLGTVQFLVLGSVCQWKCLIIFLKSTLFMY